MQIVPAIEEQQTSEYGSRLSSYALFAPLIHIDFNDGSFEEFKTAPLSEVISLTEVYSSDVFLEAHLMFARPQDAFEQVVKAGFRRAIIQFEMEDDLRLVLEEGAKFDLELGIAIGSETPAADVEPFLDLVSSVTVMTVETGKQGQPFLPQMLDKVKELRDGGFLGGIAIDGGMDPNTVKKAIEVNPDAIVVGGYFKKAENPQDVYEQLTGLLPS